MNAFPGESSSYFGLGLVVVSALVLADLAAHPGADPLPALLGVGTLMLAGVAGIFGRRLRARPAKAVLFLIGTGFFSTIVSLFLAEDAGGRGLASRLLVVLPLGALCAVAYYRVHSKAWQSTDLELDAPREAARLRNAPVGNDSIKPAHLSRGAAAHGDDRPAARDRSLPANGSERSD